MIALAALLRNKAKTVLSNFLQSELLTFDFLDIVVLRWLIIIHNAEFFSHSNAKASILRYKQ